MADRTRRIIKKTDGDMTGPTGIYAKTTAKIAADKEKSMGGDAFLNRAMAIINFLHA